MGVFEEGVSCHSLWICRCSGEPVTPHKLSDVIAVVTSLVAATEPYVDKVDTICINDGQCTGIGVCTHIPIIVTELYGQTYLPEAGLPEKGSRPFL